MLHYFIELAVWMLGFYLVGCCIGYLLKKFLKGGETVALATPAPAASAAPVGRDTPPPPPPMPRIAAVAEPVMAPMPSPPPKPVVAPVARRAEAAAAVAPVARAGKLERPKGIAAARGGKADNLQRISGVGPKNESVLHGLGFFHFDQIAAWSSDQVNWVDDHLKFNGRIKREEWIRQARLLADGKEDEFKKLYGTGGLRTRSGETLAGTRTRKP